MNTLLDIANKINASIIAAKLTNETNLSFNEDMSVLELGLALKGRYEVVLINFDKNGSIEIHAESKGKMQFRGRVPNYENCQCNIFWELVDHFEGQKITDADFQGYEMAQALMMAA